MKAAREKYTQVLDEVLDEVAEKYEELDCRSTHPTYEGSNVGIGKRSWPSKYPDWPSGLWVGHVRLDNVASDEDEYGPGGEVYIGICNDIKLDMAKVAERLLHAAKTLSKDEFRRAETWSGKSDAGLWYPLPESREKLLELLVKDKARGFIDCMVAHFESLAKFIPIIDEIFEGAAQRASK